MAEGNGSNTPRARQVMEPHQTYRFRVKAEELVSDITPSSDVFVLAHFGLPVIDLSEWRLEVSGMVGRPCVLDFDDILEFPKAEVLSFIKCAGFPADPTIATRNVSNAVWSGARLSDVLKSVEIDPRASFIWSHAPDHGTYQEWGSDRYVKDLPVDRALADDVLLAYELNGAPLSRAHGYPVRLFVPGYYGTNSVKWLSRIEASDRRAPGIFTNELYNDPLPLKSNDGAQMTVPAWAVPPEALVVFPANRARVPAGEVVIWGWCWGATEIASVEISLDKGQTWHFAEIEQRKQKSWQKFRLVWSCVPAGEHMIMARATDLDGETQPQDFARNSIHSIVIYAQ
jgi:sulfane dehydrogenase subunit SoxC